MDAGGWTILNLWLAEAKKNQISPFIVEILQVHSPSDIYYCQDDVSLVPYTTSGPSIVHLIPRVHKNGQLE